MSRTMHSTADELRQMGHEIEQLFSDEFHSAGPRQLHRYSDCWEAARLIDERIARGNQYDLIELHEPLSLTYALRRKRNPHLPPAVIFSYGLEERNWPVMIEYRRRKGIRMPIKSRITSWLLAQMASAGVRRVDHVICSNATDVRYLISAGFRPEMLTEHHSGVEPEFLTTDVWDSPREPGRVMFMGSWIERKGILDLVPAFVELSRSEPRAALTLAGVSVAPDIVLAGFPADVRPRVRVIRRVEGNQALMRLYREHSIFVLPSYFEGQPLSLIEAAASGLAPVVTDIGGNSDFVTNGINGLVVPVGDPMPLAHALRRLMCDGALSDRLRRNARYSAATYTWRDASLRLANAYSKVSERRA